MTNQSHTELAARKALHLLKRYVSETPLGHQPHMIALEAAEVIEQLSAALESPTPPERVQGEAAWENGEGWESLAWELCADENGEEACNELIWEGGPIPEPWGDRWLKYEDEAKRLIALVHKHVPATAPAQASEGAAPGWTQEEIEEVIACLGDDAAQLRDSNPEDERADNMDRAACMVQVFSDALRASTPAERVPLTDLASACLSFRHDFGLLPEPQRKALMHTAQEWARAFGIVTKQSSHGVS